MKKILSIFTVLVLLISLCACNEKTDVSSDEGVSAQESSSVQESSSIIKESQLKKEENSIYAEGQYIEHLETEDAYYVLCKKDEDRIIYCYDKEFNFKWSKVSDLEYNKGRYCTYNLNEGLLVYVKINGVFNAEYYLPESPTPQWQINIPGGLEDFLPISNTPDKFFINREQYIDINGKIESIIMGSEYGTVYPFYNYYEGANYVYLNIRDETPNSNAKSIIVALDGTYTPIACYTFEIANGDSYASDPVYDSASQRIYATAQEYPYGEIRYRVVCMDKDLNVIFEKTYEEFRVVKSFNNGTLLVKEDGRYYITDIDLNVLMEEGSGSTPGEIVKSATGYNSVFPLDGEYRHIEYDEDFKVVTYERVRGRAFVNNEGVLIKITA